MHHPRTMQLQLAQPSLKARKCQGHSFSMLSVCARQISIEMCLRRCKYTLSTPSASAHSHTHTNNYVPETDQPHTQFILCFLCVRAYVLHSCVASAGCQSRPVVIVCHFLAQPFLLPFTHLSLLFKL